MALEIFRAISNLRLVLDSETDADSPDNETTRLALREMVEILFQLMLDTGVSGTATSDPSNDDNGYFYDSAGGWIDDAHNGHTLVICSGNAKGNFYTIDDTVASGGRLDCTGDNLYSDGVRSGDDYKILYDIKVNTDGHNHDGVNSPPATVADNQITQAKMYDNAIGQAELKTSAGSVSTAAASYTNLTLPGGAYGFYPQIKPTQTGYYCYAQISSTGYTTETYATIISLYGNGGAPYPACAQQRYVTASGEVFWIFILRDKLTKDIISVWQAPDHPCFGNGSKPLLVPHPFPDFDEITQEIIVINPSQERVLEMKKKTIVKSEIHPDRDLIEVILEDYDIDETTEPDWPTKEVTVGLPTEWEEKPMGAKIQPIKKVIPRPSNIKTAALKLKNKQGDRGVEI